MAREWDAARARSLIGKHVLVAMTELEHDGTVIRKYQFHGVIIAADEEAGITIRLHGSHDTYNLPPVLEAFEPVAPGSYELESTGEVVKDPDLVTTWSRRKPARA